MYKPITIKDIAEALHLSPSTVSRALNDSYEVNPETKKRVLEYAQSNNYKKNPIALGLRKQRSYSLGVMVSEVANSFFSQAINGMESVAYSQGYHIFISQSHDSYEREVLNINHLANRSIDGLLISLSAETTDFEHIKRVYELGLPIVFFDRVSNIIDTHVINIDNFAITKQAVDQLIESDLRRIAFIGNAPHLSITEERLAGYKRAHDAHRIAYDRSLIFFCQHGGQVQQELDEIISKLLENQHRIDALLIASDRLSTRIITALTKLGDSNPNFKIVGFSNNEVLYQLQKNFTAIRQPAFDIGAKAAETLIGLIEDIQKNREIVPQAITFKANFYNNNIGIVSKI
ncbi:LacI family DNA-binding transcriptional regulator [Olivibacter sitiensis]|uniref:LacI family DNA-binding transcriptional regulator n=1 Tax=Olivibacter sitiensis TaxID=376470 RepID=UPI0003FD72C9|nr:LacI family DNA-binding transcriptional regulator [Olivibacter sitiensis]